MDKDDAGRGASGCISSSAAAAPEGVLRRRRWERNSAVEDVPEGRAPEKTTSNTPAAANRVDSGSKGHDVEATSVANRSRSIFEDAAVTTTAMSDGVTTSLRGSSADTTANDMRKGYGTERKALAGGSSTTSTQQQQPTGSRLLIEVTPRIRTFLETRVAPETRKELMVSDRIDLDVLQRLVIAANKKEDGPKVNMAELVEASQVVERIEGPKFCLNKLSFSERLRLEAEERRHQAAVRSLWGERSDRQDCFADINKSLAMGVNALLGIFLTFLGGYWAALYCGVGSFQTRVVIGLVCSICCLIVEVLLFVIHDERQRLRAKKGSVLGPPLRVN